jgi:2-polyprenyl-3-methyl-5-hydroxy-6-metoxy-1,4-benzoquinol methylase
MAPSSVAPTLKESRQQAANASGGASSNVIYDIILRVIDDLRASGELLDFGAGVGTLTRQLLKSGRFTKVVSADLMKSPAELRENWIEADLNEPLPISGSTFDTVIAAEVIEHLENPRSTAREMFRLLKPGGIAILTTPNNESWRALLSLLLRGHYVAFLESSYPAHITALLRKDLSRILIEAGFQNLEFRYTNWGGLPGKPRTTWQKVSAGLLRGVRFSDNLLVIAHKPGASH